MTKNRQYESMTRVPLNHWTVRVWCTEKDARPGPNARVVTAVMQAAIKARTTFDQPHTISRALDKLSHVAAYEIVDLNGNGAVCYPDWR